MAGTDEVMERIMAAIEVGRTGETALARDRLTALWEEVGPDGDPLHRCTVAHYLADLQEDPVDELAWDQRALDAAGTLTDERAQQFHSSLAVKGFLPSLHLNLAEDHRTLGDLARAREHVDLAQRLSAALPDDPYGTMVRQAIARVSAALPAPAPPDAHPAAM